jgi:hypothetical protein
MGCLCVGARNNIFQRPLQPPILPDSFFPFAHPILLLLNEPISRLSDEHSMRSGQVSMF